MKVPAKTGSSFSPETPAALFRGTCDSVSGNSTRPRGIHAHGRKFLVMKTLPAPDPLAADQIFWSITATLHRFEKLNRWCRCGRGGANEALSSKEEI